MAKQANCPLCGKLADANLEHCPHCGGPMRDAMPGAKAAASKDSGTEPCPSCGNTVRDGDIICVRCGTNLLTGQKIADEQQESAARERGSQTRKILLGVLAAALLLVAGGAYILLQNPVKEARRLAIEGNVIGAIEVLREFAAAHPERGDAQFLMGQLNWQASRYEEAANAFDTAFEANPGNVEAGRSAVLAASKLSALDGGDRQLDALERLAERHPDDAEGQRLLALAYGKRGDLETQRRILTELAATSTLDGATKQYLGLSSALSGDMAAAEKALTEADRLGASGAREAQGLLSALQGNKEAARQRLEGVAANGSLNAYTQARLGLLALEDGDFQAASKAFKLAQSASDIVEAVTFFRGVCMKELGLTPEALGAFEQLMVTDSDFGADAAVQTALIHMISGETSRAEEALRRASQFGAASAQYHTAQARLESINGELQKAQQTVRTASRVDSQYPGAHLESGLIYIRRGVLEDGIRELERYIELAGADNARGRVNEIELLVEQLRQSLNRPIQTAASAR